MKTCCFSLFLLLYLLPTVLHGQSHLSQPVDIYVDRERVEKVLKMLEQQGNFSFSYKSNLFDPDRIVDIKEGEQTVLSVLKSLFQEEFYFQSKGNHIIILKQDAPIAGHTIISGYVSDRNNGQPVAFASVYDPELLVGTMTNADGYFRLILKSNTTASSLRISKISYADTVFILPEKTEQNLNLSIEPLSYALDTVEVNIIEGNWLARQLLSSRQVMNSMNLKGFLARQPLQFSLVPGLGSHGRMGAQVINKFSFNILGGYTAGVRGFELGGLFNIVKRDMQFVQVGGLFNLVGGDVNGVQVGGLYNSVKGNTTGLQLSGLININKKTGTGLQIAGIYNQAQAFRGFQLSGIGKVNQGKMKGLSIAGVFNKSKSLHGVQLSSIVNISKSVDGLQIGLVNIADTNRGLSIGLVNISRTGYHKIAASLNENNTLFLSYKSGNHKLYSIITAGSRISLDKKLFAFGYGMGSDIKTGKKGFFINPELIHLYYYNGNWARQNLSGRLQIHLKYAFSPGFRIYGGPTLNFLYAKPEPVSSGYLEQIIPPTGSLQLNDRLGGWIGWSFGVEIL